MSDSTPMMKQYDRLKSQYHDAILFFRLGDFYEMFKTDAQEASEILGLTLTSRNGIQMCGIPHHAALSYIPKLLEAGKKVAVCEQINLSKKGIAEREVTEILSPGTVVDESCLNNKNHNFIASIYCPQMSEAVFLLSLIDVSTGELIIKAEESNLDLLLRDIQLYNPREILIQESLFDGQSNIIAKFDQTLARINRFPDWHYHGANAWERLCQLLGLNNLKSYGLEQDSLHLFSIPPLLEYVETNTGKQIRRINSLKVIRENDHVVIDGRSQLNLEIFYNRALGSDEMTLFSVIDKTRTAMGRRLFRQWLLHPLISHSEIRKRQDLVSVFYHNQLMLQRCREVLGTVLDLPRLSVRVSMDKAHPKDMVAIRRSLEGYLKLHSLCSAPEFTNLVSDSDISDLQETINLLAVALVDNPPINFNEGEIIREGFHAEIDRLRRTESGSHQTIADYLKAERAKSGINNLRIKHNSVIGYFLEVSKVRAKNVPEHFESRQSLINTDRFTTSELRELAAGLSVAKDDRIELEKQIFLQVRSNVQSRLGLFFAVGDALAEIDCLQSMGYQATLSGYVCPEIVNSNLLDIRGGRHPVVETSLESGSFVSNDLLLNENNFFSLITGPNMSGKSTYLRQNALIVLLAQIGSFIPADSARIGIINKIFCRVGASDNLARGESTFLVEMNETAHILKNADSRSLVIMDEVGRGTSTQDGLAIALAVSEYMLQYLKCRTLFATHFHELSQIDHANLRNFSLGVEEEYGNIVFLNKVIDGPSNNSYGLHVAKIAGVPEQIISRAGEILENGESSVDFNLLAKLPLSNKNQHLQGRRGMFGEDELVIQELRNLDIDSLTPIEALNCLYRLKKVLSSI